MTQSVYYSLFIIPIHDSLLFGQAATSTIFLNT